MVFNNLEICNGRLIASLTTKTVIQSDDSRKSWEVGGRGGVSSESVNRGKCSLHINVLELLSIKLALLTFSKMFNLNAAHFQVDNMSALSCLIKRGGVGGGCKEYTKQGDDSHF